MFFTDHKTKKVYRFDYAIFYNLWNTSDCRLLAFYRHHNSKPVFISDFDERDYNSFVAMQSAKKRHRLYCSSDTSKCPLDDVVISYVNGKRNNFKKMKGGDKP